MRALVTGAGGAIGAGIVKRLLSQGYEVIAQDIREESLAKLGDEGITKVVGDLMNEEDQKHLVAACESGILDVVIAAHGLPGAGALKDVNSSFIKSVVRVNGSSIPALMKLTLPALRASKGVFVTIASQAALRGEANNSVYCAAKYSTVGFIKHIEPTLTAEGVSLRVLCPGCTKSPLLYSAMDRFAKENGKDPEQFMQEWMESIPVGRFGEVEEVAAAAVYLAERGKRPLIFASTGGDVTY